MQNKRILLAGLTSMVILLAVWAGSETASPPPSAPQTANGSSLKPGPNDARIAHVAARLLEEFHYSQQPLDEELSEKFYDGYVNSLDPRHENFFQSDLDEFSVYRTNLDKLTIDHGLADLTPAFKIYNRYAERIQQHHAYVAGLLKSEKFKFNVPEEKIVIDRRHAPFPKNLAEAEALWRERLRYEYLQEKLTREVIETNDTLVVKLPADAAKDIPDTLLRHYRWNQRMMTNLDSDKILQVYLNALAHAYDPHSDYFSAPRAQDFSIGMNLSLFGIGAQLREDDGYCTVFSLVPGGPAAKSKQLNEKDRIVAVAQGDQPPVDVVDMDLEKVVQLVRGPKNTEVRLTVSPATDRTARKVVPLVRDEIKLEDAEAKAKLIEFPDGKRIGIIDLPSFYAPVGDGMSGNQGHVTPKFTSVDVAKLVKRLKQEKVSGIIIDLRSNPGGSLEEAIRFTGLFIKDGPVVQARIPDGQVAVESDPDPTELYSGPLVVMINRFSASASEIAAAALQDYGRAIVVGDISTHGKGTVQNLNLLKQFMPGVTNDPGTLKMTIRKFYRVSGASTQLKGVVPDIVLPDMLNYSDQIGESSLENPLPWDTIKPANYEKFNLVQPFLPELKNRSDERIATNQDFRYVKQDIDLYVKQQAEKTATINEQQAIKERKDVFARNKTREAERIARNPSGIKVYEITVKNADKPGLTESGATNEVASVEQPGTEQPGSDTNATTVAKAPAAHGAKPADKADKKTPPPFDPMLDETQQILLDYISQLNKTGTLAAHNDN